MRRLLPLLLTSALVLGACSEDEPPEWLVERATPTSEATTTTTTPPTTTVPEPGQVLAAVDLVAGQCLEDASAFTGGQTNEIARIRALPCRLPHQAEVYLREDLAARPNARFPGAGQLREQAQQRCQDGFQRYVGVRWTRSELEIAALWPSPESWPRGDRLLACVAFRADGEPLTGTVRGARL